MSTSTSEDDDVDPFDIFIEEIGAEINDAAFRIMKRLSQRKLKIQKKLESMKDPSELIHALVEAKVISENNLSFLSKILKVARKTNLAERVSEYQARHCGKGEERKRRNSDAGVSYNRRYMDIPVPVTLDKASIKDQTLYFALVNVFNHTIEEIAKSDIRLCKKMRLRQKAVKDLESEDWEAGDSLN
ncbi:uncharacterized protein LOC144364585 [Saccoglossus kowalevskii]